MAGCCLTEYNRLKYVLVLTNEKRQCTSDNVGPAEGFRILENFLCVLEEATGFIARFSGCVKHEAIFQCVIIVEKSRCSLHEIKVNFTQSRSIASLIIVLKILSRNTTITCTKET